MATPEDAAFAAKLGAQALTATVRSTRPLTPHLHELVLDVQDPAVAGVPGNDIMVSVSNGERFVRRRYSVRDVSADSLTLWIRQGHDGPGATWAAQAQVGDATTIIGPRGKIVLDPLADWHLFVGDEASLSAFYRLAESIDPPGQAIFILVLSEPDDFVPPASIDGIGYTAIFVDRNIAGSSPLLDALAAFEFPLGDGHAYLFGEFSEMRQVQAALLDRGLAADAISLKAFWRRGRENRDHGEPDKEV